MSKHFRFLMSGLTIMILFILLPCRSLATPPHDSTNGIECLTCHGFHKTGSFGYGFMPQGDQQEGLCKSCHNPTGPASNMSSVGNHVVGGGSPNLDCGTCHDPHNPDSVTDSHTGTTANNLNLIRYKARGVVAALPEMIFHSKPQNYAFGDTDAPYNGVCQTCHTQTIYHRNDGTVTNQHAIGAPCISCHTHASGFQPRHCDECHDQPQGIRRQIVGPGGDFDQASKHISGAIEDSDCLACHDISMHSMGVVLMNDPDNGGPWAGTGTDFCLTCHDGSPPPGISFPAASGTGYDKSGFSGSAHQQNLSQNACLHCHNAHGSSQSSLLTDNYVVNDYNPWSLGDGDYAVCWKCHDETKIIRTSGGVKAVNAFDDRHDKHVRGEDAPCIVCHDVHAGADSAESGLITFDYPMANSFDMSWNSGYPDSSSAFWISGSRGYCNIMCHNEDHKPEDYDRQPTATTGCTPCHSSDGTYAHSPAPTSCSYCHSADRPAVPHPKIGDCVECHDQPGVTWLGATYNHNPLPDLCAPCHETDRPVAPHVPSGDCVECHDQPGVTWLGATYSHTPTPSTCAGCHEGTRPAADTGHPQGADCVVCHDQPGVTWTSVVAYDHTPVPTSCTLCHEPDRPAAPHVPSEDCVLCHDQPGITWLGATYSHSPTPTSCDNCHESDRPASPHFQSNDCVDCHAQPGVTWLGATYSHSPPPATCAGCHEATRPVAPHDQTNDCSMCHNDPGVSWLGATGCTGCHDKPQGIRRQIVGQGGDFDKSSTHVSGTVADDDCINCHEMSQHQQGTVVLKDPDNGGIWAGTETGYCLTCHDGTPPAGVSFPAASGTGYDKSAFSGTSHATNLGAASCRQCHESHGSQYSSLLKGNYVMTDYNTWSQGDGDYDICWQCHSENNIVTGKNRFEDYHDKHVRSEQAPCITCHDVHAPFDSGEAGLISFEYPMQNGYDMNHIGGRNNSTSFWISGSRGYCYLNCHNKRHDPKDYNR